MLGTAGGNADTGGTGGSGRGICGSDGANGTGGSVGSVVIGGAGSSSSCAVLGSVLLCLAMSPIWRKYSTVISWGIPWLCGLSHAPFKSICTGRRPLLLTAASLTRQPATKSMTSGGVPAGGVGDGCEHTAACSDMYNLTWPNGCFPGYLVIAACAQRVSGGSRCVGGHHVRARGGRRCMRQWWTGSYL